MANSWTVKSGDTLWRIATEQGKYISGNDIWAKINTLRKVNNIGEKDYIYVDQIIYFSKDGSGSGSTTSNNSKAKINGIGLQSEDTTGRAVYAHWTFNREHTKGYQWRWSQYLGDRKIWIVEDGNVDIPKNTPDENLGEYCHATFTAESAATKVRFQVLPISDTYKNGNNDDVNYWSYGGTNSTVKWSDIVTYDFADNPPFVPDTPSIEIKDRTLIASIDGIDAKKLGAKYVQFNLVKDNATSLGVSVNAEIDTDGYYVSHQYENITFGSQYKVRARSVSAKGKVSGWSGFSPSAGTRPSAPATVKASGRKRSDGSLSAYVEWSEVKNATNYTVEYTTIYEDFEHAPDNVSEVTTEDARTSIEVTGIEAGHDYYFRVKAVNGHGESDPTEAAEPIPIGEPPAAPTTWSSSKSTYVGDNMELSWIHNARDGSPQSYAQLSLKINDSGWTTFTFENKTTVNSGETKETETFTYGQAISYKGELYVQLDTTHAALKDAEVQWKVRTAGVTDAFSDTDWSTDRTVYIYEKPILALSVTSDLAAENIVETLTGLPFYIRGVVELSSYKLQRPIGYHLRIISNDYYETVDDAGRTKTINAGDSVYSKYFDTNEILIVEMSADNIDLESGMSYTVRCTADMSTGLSVDTAYDFTVSWVDVSYTIRANIVADNVSYTAGITPYCEDLDGNLVEGVTISVYRREYNGTLTEIATGIPNNGTTITDPHPALDYARYRLVAKDIDTGAISFYDMPGYPIKCSSVIIQWDEEWNNYDVADDNSVENPDWSGSMLVLPYNISISDNRKRDVALVNYAGREYPVTYYGTKIGETSSWSMDIPSDDAETIYALRRLSLWPGNVYVREPSGMGFWANIVPRFNIKYNTTTIPVTLDITRVEGGV